jgi:hypothetical protein
MLYIRISIFIISLILFVIYQNTHYLLKVTNISEIIMCYSSEMHGIKCPIHITIYIVHCFRVLFTYINQKFAIDHLLINMKSDAYLNE